MKVSEFAESVHAIISKNLEVKATPIIRKDGTIGAGAVLTLGNIEEDILKLGHDLGLEPDPIVEVDKEAEQNQAAEPEDETDAQK